MYRERREGLIYSVVFHLLLLLLIIFGLPSILRNEPPIEPIAITVELLPISELSNVKPSEIEKTEKQTPEPKQAEQTKPSPPVKTSEPTPPPPEPEPTPLPTPPKPEVPKKTEPVKPIPKPKEPEKTEPKKVPEKPKEDDFTAILKSVKITAQKEKTTDQKEPPKENTSATSKAKSSIYDPNKSMSISEIGIIQGQISKCWVPPSGAKDAQDLDIYIDAEYNADGSNINAQLSDKSRSRYNSDQFFRAAAEAALRAVRMCNQLKNLPQDKYDAWKEIELHFNPKDMLQ